MPVNPPRAPGELADEVEAMLRSMRPEDIAAGSGFQPLMGFTGPEWCTILTSLRSATGDGGEAKEPHDYEVIGTTYDGVKVLRSVSEPTNFTREEIRAAVEAALQPRSTKIEGAGDNA